MKTLFIPVKIKLKIDKVKILKISGKLPKKIAIAYPIQYKDFAYEVKKILSKKHKITRFIQVLGCLKPKFTKDTQAVLLIGSGKFHGISLAYESMLPIYIYEGNKLSKISKKDTEIFEGKNKASYLKFLNSEKIGILVSIKPGQENFRKTLELKKRLKNKKSYIFVSNNININEFENFNLESWVNTACPRLDITQLNNNIQSSIININRIKES